MQITYTATGTDGQTYTRSSGTMAYVAVSIGSQVMWHKSWSAAYAAAKGKYQTYGTGVPADVVPAVPTAIQGRFTWTQEQTREFSPEHADAILALAAEKAISGIVAAQPAKKETPAEARRRQRAAKKAREAAEAAASERQAQEDAYAASECIVTAPVAKVELKRGQVVRPDGTIGWKNSGEAHNAYRRARRAALKAQAAS